MENESVMLMKCWTPPANPAIRPQRWQQQPAATKQPAYFCGGHHMQAVVFGGRVAKLHGGRHPNLHPAQCRWAFQLHRQ
jgi:hypothetical protein